MSPGRGEPQLDIGSYRALLLLPLLLHDAISLPYVLRDLLEEPDQCFYGDEVVECWQLTSFGIIYLMYGLTNIGGALWLYLVFCRSLCIQAGTNLVHRQFWLTFEVLKGV